MKNKWIRWTFFSIFIGYTGFFFSVVRKDPFSISILKESVERVRVPFVCPELGEILAKPLHFIGCGSEAIAFASEDEQYVIKFFLTQKLNLKGYFKPKSRIEQLLFGIRKDRSIDMVLRRYEDALRYIPEEAAMVAVHRYRSVEDLPICEVIDQEKKKHLIDLNKVAFVVQKKAVSIEKLQDLSEKSGLEEKCFALFDALSSKGFVWLSKRFNPSNFALVKNRAVIIDLGKLEFLPEFPEHQELVSLKEHYTNWTKHVQN